jgi:hypothetical protein
LVVQPATVAEVMKIRHEIEQEKARLAGEKPHIDAAH